jgi:hypothetical protein
LTLVFCDGTILRLRQDEIVKALAEQHQAAPCEYQILAAIEKQVKEHQQQQRQQQQRHTGANQKVNRKATTTTTAFWKECASQILASIQTDQNDLDDGKSSNGSFHVLDLTASRASSSRAAGAARSHNTIPHNKQGVHDIDADDEETTSLDLTKHIYSTSAARPNSSLKNSGKDVMSTTTIALISIEDTASTTMDNSQQQQQHDNNISMAMRMRNGFVQACRQVHKAGQSSCYMSKIPVYSSPTFLTTTTTTISPCTSTTISSSISLPPASAAAHYNDCHDACQDRQAAMITLLQHVLYQNRRLVPDICQASSVPEKDNDVNNGDKKADDADDKFSLPNAKKLKKKKKKKNNHK